MLSSSYRHCCRIIFNFHAHTHAHVLSLSVIRVLLFHVSVCVYVFCVFFPCSAEFYVAFFVVIIMFGSVLFCCGPFALSFVLICCVNSITFQSIIIICVVVVVFLLLFCFFLHLLTWIGIVLVYCMLDYACCLHSCFPVIFLYSTKEEVEIKLKRLRPWQLFSSFL